MLKLPFIFIFLFLKVSPYLFQSLLLIDFLSLCSHCTNFFELVHLKSIHFRVSRHSRNHSQLVILLCKDMHNSSFFYFQIFASKFILSENKVFWEWIFFLTTFRSQSSGYYFALDSIKFLIGTLYDIIKVISIALNISTNTF